MGHNSNVKRLARRLALAWAGATLGLQTAAAFTSLYVFGDGVSTTTNGPGGSLYYGNRYCNGRVWVEVLAQRQGLPFIHARNWSFFGHYSPNLVTNVTAFVPPPDANTALFVVWVNNADFVFNLENYAPFNNSNLATWTNANRRSLSNHWQAIQILHAKGARTLILPNAVDVTQVPFYNGLDAASRSFVRARILEFNAGLVTLLNQARATLPGLVIYMPDFFELLESILVNPSAYGLTNAIYEGKHVDALSDPRLGDKSLNGPGAHYLFWDYLDPSAKAQAIMANLVQQMIAPVRLAGVVAQAASNRLDVLDMPIGRDGTVETSTNLVHWTAALGFTGSATQQSLWVPAAGSTRFYRLWFPFTWSWP